MFNLVKFGLHFTHLYYGAFDPMVVELIRTERMMRHLDKAEKVVEPAAWQTDAANEEDVREAA